LGPEIYIDSNGIDYKTRFRNFVRDKPNLLYFENDNVFYFNKYNGNNDDHLDTLNEVLDFYNNGGNKELLELISRVNFPLIINVSPDMALNNLFRKYDIKFEEAFFGEQIEKLSKKTLTPGRDSPIIYNMYGCVDYDQSLILNHRKLYQVIQAILSEGSLPEEIEKYLKLYASSFIFLGFRFDSWYYQLICHKILSKLDENKVNIKLGTSQFDGESPVNIIMTKTFEMKFTTESPMDCINNLMKVAIDNSYKGCIRVKRPLGTYSVFISYAYKDDIIRSRDNIVGLIEQEFIEDETLYQLFRDVNEIKYGDSIDEFMTKIGKGKTVIRVISDKYLKSAYCMIEALRIDEYKYNDKRTFSVVLEDAFDMENKIKEYKDYWLKKYQEILVDPSKLESGEYDEYLNIYRFIERFIRSIKDEKKVRLHFNDVIKSNENTFSIAENRKNGFDEFMDTVKNKIKEG